jgi:hypothetical protein
MGASVLMESVFYLRRRTGCKFWVALASTTVMLLAYAGLIPAYGALGAAYATLIGFVFHAGLTLLVAQRIYRVRYEFGRLSALLGSALLLWLLSRYVGSGLTTVPLKAGLWLLWPALLWWAGVVAPDEKASATTAVRTLLGRWRVPAAHRHPTRNLSP